MSVFLWLVLGVIYFVVLLSLGLQTLRGGHLLLFFVGIIFPVLWLVGAFDRAKPAHCWGAVAGTVTTGFWFLDVGKGDPPWRFTLDRRDSRITRSGRGGVQPSGHDGLMSGSLAFASHARKRLATIGLFTLMTAALLTGCGSSSASTSSGTSTSKPAYCSDVTSFKNAVEQLKHATGPSALVTDAKKVATTGQATIAAVKTTSLAPEIASVKSSLGALDNSLATLTNSGSLQSAAKKIRADATAVVTAGENLAAAAKPNCS